MTVTEAIAFFADAKEVAQKLAPLADVGLEYVKLGQPVPTLSGGEAQRLKLAGHLAAAGGVASSTTHNGKLFLFDEPTTGLHFEDVAKLLRAFRKLLAAGHSLLVIEHNLDLIRASDWIIDLGPEGGDRGGEIVCAGTPAQSVARTSAPTPARRSRCTSRRCRRTRRWRPPSARYRRRAARRSRTSARSTQTDGEAAVSEQTAHARGLAAAKNAVVIHNAASTTSRTST